MNSNYMYILLFFFMKPKKMVYDATGLIHGIVSQPEISNAEKMEIISCVIEEYGLNEIAYEKKQGDDTITRCPYDSNMLKAIANSDYHIQFMAKEVSLELLDGSIFIQVGLN